MRDDILGGETAIITGGAQGIGKAIAERFAAEGANVVIADINDQGETTVDELPGEAHFAETDVTDADDVSALVDVAKAEFDSVDILVNNAGGSFDDDNLHRISESTFERNIAVNLKGAFLCAKACLPAMIETGGGRMVHMSSVNGLTGIGLTSYSAAKAGILSLSRTIAIQYGRHGVRSNAICPGTINTKTRREEMDNSGTDEVHQEWLEQYALGRFGQPEEVADAALFLASDLSSFATGTELVVDGGLTAGLDQTIERLIYNIDEDPLSES